MEKIHGFTLTEIFEQASINKLGVSFEQFCSAPMTTLQVVGQCDAIDIMCAGFRSLLPVQVKLRRTLEAEWEQEGNLAEPRRRRRNPTHRTDVSMACSHRIALAA
jgi:hypothetical protein